MYPDSVTETSSSHVSDHAMTKKRKKKKKRQEIKGGVKGKRRGKAMGQEEEERNIPTIRFEPISPSVFSPQTGVVP